MNRRTFIKSFIGINSVILLFLSGKIFYKKNNTLNTYNDNYDTDFDFMKKSGYESGQKVIDLFSKYYNPKSVVDVGCGIGAWLKVWQNKGIKKIKGYDLYADKEKLLIPVKDFENINLDNETETIKVKEKYDLAMCVETAEHINPKASDNLVNLLSSLSDVILFSAAIPYQLGHYHYNCRPLQFWVDKFSAKGFLCFDILRKDLMEKKTINDWWYAQNTLVFIKRTKSDIFLNKGLKCSKKPALYYCKESVDCIISAVRNGEDLP